ncbi:calcium-binding protein [Methylobacterium sp. HMF5984]|uniref:calcium-binding protein n=1 Tax=Methylobacterium sp. HMF5984 TaxID=3367370 RepID=UPI0038535874
MSSVTVSTPNGFYTPNLWVQGITSSDNAHFEGLVSTNNDPLVGILPGHEVDTYSSLSFTQGGVTYQYSGMFTVTADRGLLSLSGSVSASGYYDHIEVSAGGNSIASYDGVPIPVDFGSHTTGIIPDTVSGVLGLVNGLLFGPSTEPTQNYQNLTLGATPNLPDIAFSDGVTISGNSGADILVGSTNSDAIIGGAGNDVIVGGAGSNFMSGGAGDDTVVLGFKLTDASISYDAAGHTVLDGPNGAHNVLSGFEHFQFTDGTVNENTGSALVDDLYYYVNNKDVFAAGADPETHYNQYGWHEGRNPNADFSTTGYLAANADVAKAGINPLTQYDQFGWKEGRDPSANFDNELYLSHNPDVKAAGLDPLGHYLAYGQAEGRQAYAAIGKAGDLGVHPGFDAEYYLLSNTDVAKAALTAGGDSFAFAYNHYEAFGWHEGRNPNAVFDTKGYLNAYADVKAANIDPLAHYDSFGWHEGRDPSASFDTNAYEAANADVKAAGIDPMQHYLQYGAIEGRSAYADGVFHPVA